MANRMTTHVECYAGASYPEKPRALTWQGHRYTVDAILSQKREPDGLRFQVRCRPDDALFDLFYSITTNAWQIQSAGLDQQT